MTNQFDDRQIQEYTALNHDIGFVRFNQRTQIQLTGRDRAKFLHSFCTNDITRLNPGDGCEAFITNVQGKILAFLHVACGNDSIRLETVAGQAERLMAHLDKYLIADDVEIIDLTEQLSMIGISGRKCPSVLSQVTGTPMPERPCDHVVASYRSSEMLIQSTRAKCEATFHVSIENSQAENFVAELESAGAKACSLEIWDICRIEAGFPEYGRDISEKNLPQEVRRDKTAISFTKGCYLGQETVARIDALGHVNRHLVGVRCENISLPSADDEFKTGDATVGSVTSVCFSPKLNAFLALGYVRREHSEAGTQLVVNNAAAEVVELPLKHDGKE